MNTKRFVGALCVLILISSNIYAEPGGKKGGGKQEDILSAVLLDGNLDQIGTVVGVSGLLEVITFVEVQNDFDETRLTALEINWRPPSNDDNPFKINSTVIQNTLGFDDFGCTGRAFIELRSPWENMAGAVFPSALIRRNLDTEWYVATSLEPETFVIKSLWLGAFIGTDQTCRDIEPVELTTSVPAERIELNIFDRFPLPYTLELR